MDEPSCAGSTCQIEEFIWFWGIWKAILELVDPEYLFEHNER